MLERISSSSGDSTTSTSSEAWTPTARTYFHDVSLSLLDTGNYAEAESLILRFCAASKAESLRLGCCSSDELRGHFLKAKLHHRLGNGLGASKCCRDVFKLAREEPLVMQVFALSSPY